MLNPLHSTEKYTQILFSSNAGVIVTISYNTDFEVDKTHVGSAMFGNSCDMATLNLLLQSSNFNLC